MRTATLPEKTRGERYGHLAASANLFRLAADNLSRASRVALELDRDPDHIVDMARRMATEGLEALGGCVVLDTPK